MPPTFQGNPRRWFVVPFILGIMMMAFAVLGWVYPRLVLFLLLFPLFMMGLGLVLFGLDLWKGVPNWKKRAHHVRYYIWPGQEDRQ